MNGKSTTGSQPRKKPRTAPTPPDRSSIVAFQDKRPEAIERRRKRREVRRLTVREYDGRSWEWDHELSGQPGSSSHLASWRPRG